MSRSEPRWWEDDRHVLAALGRAIREEAAGLEGARVVDLGAGDAPYRALFTGPYVRCDIEGGEVRIGPDGRTPLEAGSADLVVSFQVLEHVWDVGAYLAECRRLLAPGGRLLLSTHGVWPWHPHPGDFRRWTREGLVRELEGASFEVMRMRGLVGPLAWTTQVRLLGINRALRRVAGPVLAGPFAVAMNLRMAIEDRLTPAAVREDHACVFIAMCRDVSVAGSS